MWGSRTWKLEHWGQDMDAYLCLPMLSCPVRVEALRRDSPLSKESYQVSKYSYFLNYFWIGTIYSIISQGFIFRFPHAGYASYGGSRFMLQLGNIAGSMFPCDALFTIAFHFRTVEVMNP
jgi:hypothetical protein